MFVPGSYWGIKDNTDLIDIGKYIELWVVAALFEPVGAAAGFGIATLLGMDDASKVSCNVFVALLFDGTLQ